MKKSQIQMDLTEMKKQRVRTLKMMRERKGEKEKRRK
jgi:hypothetical protein